MNVLVSPARCAALAATLLVLAGSFCELAAQYPIQPYMANKPNDEFMGNGDYLFSFGFRQNRGMKVNVDGATDGITWFTGGQWAPREGGDIGRTYNDGGVNRDVDGNPGNLTASWSFGTREQVDNAVPGTIDYHLYAADAGGRIAKETELDKYALDVEITRILFRPYKRVVIGLVAGASIGPIADSGNVDTTTTLLTLTDTYSANGIDFSETRFAKETLPYTAASATVDGVVTPAPKIGSVILDRRLTTTAGAAKVNSTWNLSGAYYNFRLGPSIHLRASRRFSFSASAGVSTIFTATKLEYTDTFNASIGPKPTTSEELTGNDWIPGYYAEAAVNLWISDRTGFFAGASIQKNDSFTHRYKTRSVTINFDDTMQVGFGMTVRF